MIDIKAIRKTADYCLKKLHAADTPHPTNWIIQMHPATLIAMCDEIDRLRKDAARYQWLVEYFVGDRTDLDDAIVGASDIGVEQVTAVIDAAMESK